MYLILPLVLGLFSLAACVKSVPPQTPSAQSVVAATNADNTLDTPPKTVDSVVLPSSEQPTSPVESDNTTTMQLKVGFGSEQVLAVNVACGEFRLRRSIQNKEVVISNIPPNSPQCRLKFSPGGGVYILQNYRGGVLECVVSNGNEVTCKLDD